MTRGVFARDREVEICSLSPGRELYARVDPFVQIAATNFKKNMSSPSSQLSSPPRRIPSFRRTLMRKISKRRSSSSLADPLNRQKRHRMPPRYRSGGVRSPSERRRNESFTFDLGENEPLNYVPFLWRCLVDSFEGTRFARLYS